jgi:hypothetical protein
LTMEYGQLVPGMPICVEHFNVVDEDSPQHGQPKPLDLSVTRIHPVRWRMVHDEQGHVMGARRGRILLSVAGGRA